MNKTKLLSIFVILLVLINLALIAFFVLRTPPHPRHAGPRNLVIEKLNFNTAQINAYDDLIQSHRKDISASEQEIKRIKNLLYASLAIDSKEAFKDSLIKVLGDMQCQIETIHYKHFMAIKQICTTEQLQAFDELSKELAVLFSAPPRLRKNRNED